MVSGQKHSGGAILPFNWRGWLDYGGGALADMACHTMDSIFMSLDPGFPTHVEAIHVDTLTDTAFPKGSTLKWTFGAKGDRPGFEIYWYDGTKSKLLVSGDYGDSCRIIPEADHQALAMELKEKIGSTRPPRVYEKSIGHHTEWREAAMGKQALRLPGLKFQIRRTLHRDHPARKCLSPLSW